MRAAVEQNTDVAIHTAHHDHRLAADLHGDVIACLFDLRLVSAVDPGLLPDVLHLPIEYLLIGVDGLVDTIGFDQSFERLHALSPYGLTLGFHQLPPRIYAANGELPMPSSHRLYYPGLWNAEVG